jgi:hypothetical protein
VIIDGIPIKLRNEDCYEQAITEMPDAIMFLPKLYLAELTKILPYNQDQTPLCLHSYLS